MYESCGICALSEAQQKKMMKGLGVRVMAGDISVMLSAQQAKKLKSASKKGAGIVLHLDPYQVDMLKGGSFFDKISRPFRDVVHKVESGGKKLADRLKKQAEEKAKRVKAVADKAIFEAGREAEKAGREVEKVAKSDSVKRMGKKVAGVALRKGLPVLGGIAGTYATGNPLGAAVGAEAGNILGNELADMAGVGALKKTLRKVKKGGALRVAGGALRVAGRK